MIARRALVVASLLAGCRDHFDTRVDGGLADAPPDGTPADPIRFVQSAFAPDPTMSQTANAVMSSPQQQGDLNVVVVTTYAGVAVNGVGDSAHNAYTAATGVIVEPDNDSAQLIYYATDIAAAGAGNVVSVVFASNCDYDVRVLEYAGAGGPDGDASSAFGTSANLLAGPVTTTRAGDLLIAANAQDKNGRIVAPGDGYTTRVTTPAHSIVEERIAGAPGTFMATATQLDTKPWLFQLVAFKPSPP